MRSIGGPELVVLAFILLLFGAPIWIALKAKPLGEKPYRWATYLAIENGFVGLMLFCFAISLAAQGNIVGAALQVSVVIPAALSSYGLIRRKRFGVVAFVVCYVLLIIVPPLMDTIYNRQTPSQPSGNGFYLLILLIISIVYFKRRWPLMASTQLPSPGQ